MHLQIQVKEAHDLRRANLLGKNDVYILVKQGMFNKAQTTIKKNAGKTAIFNETLQIEFKPGEDLTVEAYDHDSGKDDMIGAAAIPASGLSGGSWSGDLVLLHNGKPAGSVSLLCRH